MPLLDNTVSMTKKAFMEAFSKRHSKATRVGTASAGAFYDIKSGSSGNTVMKNVFSILKKHKYKFITTPKAESTKVTDSSYKAPEQSTGVADTSEDTSGGINRKKRKSVSDLRIGGVNRGARY